MITKLSERSRSSFRAWVARLAGVSILAPAIVLGVSSTPAFADTSEGGNWDAPPTCFRDGVQAHKHVQADGSYLMGLYQYSFEYSYRRYYANGYETRYVWVYEVQSPMGGLWEMQTVGFAHKLCGGTWTQTSSNIA